jgi:hypothetical protein
MKTLLITTALASALALTACETVPPDTPVSAMAANEPVCAASHPIDVNGDGWISGDEWNTFHTSGYGAWDMNHDGRVSRAEFEACYRAGGFYPASYYNPDYWTNYWSAFDTNGDGYLSADEYWSASTWARIDANHNGKIDPTEWVWWPH